MHAPRSRVRPVRLLSATLLAATLALAGCSGTATDSGGKSSADRAGAKAAAPGAEQQGATDNAKGGGAGRATAAPRLAAQDIIRTASLTVQVKDVPKAIDTARTAAENAGGYVGKENTDRDSGGREHTRIVLRVPTEKYDAVLADLQGTGKLLDRTAQAEDVTEQVVDVDSRIKSQRASVARVRDLMDKATKLSDVVSLEGELSSREADLEALLAQQASLKNRTGFATITLSLSETPVHEAAKDDERTGFGDALAGGWHVLATMLRWIGLALAAALPFLVPVGLLVLVWIRLVRPRRAARRLPAPPAPPQYPGHGPEGPATPH
ncbi:DUF4349 domain-containing protein [Streptomyces sp. RY43-2]|uniref:DUF4349 domain-containing protein n=1 Tax=Streptomyces macrolidinus TaxID=2952607 RepID=A0ABT0ZH34_9ACTN|nr:DUF4349 domain-containing protein [Streptomyces macrolidinus]MCN9242898.1 DUF4349 domain-containing protein [Streptomyces macrolidinus]